MNSAAIKDLERRYKTLVNDYQTGKIDESTFVTRVDKLQLQDDMGRYWMIGAQTGAWHYYDGQAWHQADPRETDTLPFIDAQGRYWQRGTRSGDWYYYESATGEWVKPDPSDPDIPGSTRSYTAPQAAPYQSQLHSTQSGPNMPSQMDGELFQDDEGRYWMMGAKSGQWYFYDHNGWHPAHEFQQQAQSYSQSYYQPQAPQYGQAGYATYAPQPPYQQPYFQNYGTQQPAYQPQQSPAAQPAPAEARVETSGGQTRPPDTGTMPNPPANKSESGSWYYFDGKQWLQYSSGEPASDVPPANPEMILDQAPGATTPKTQAKPAAAPATAAAEPVVVAELFEEDDDAEVVDVEVITIIEAEPDEEPAPAATAVSERTSVTEPVARATSAPPDTEDVIPRRVTRPISRPVPRVDTETGKDRPVEPVRQAAPKKRDEAYEPTIIIPTESSASSINTPKRSSQPVRPVEPRRARESTIPMETIPAAGVSTAAQLEARAASEPRPDVTQPLVPKNPRTRTDSNQLRVQPRTKTDEFRQARTSEDTKDGLQTPKPTAATSTKTEKSGYTLGEILRAFPSTVWTFVGGFIVLLVFAFIIIAAFFMLNDNNSVGVNPVAVEASLTPTMSAAMAGFTPTPGPTPEETTVALAPTEAPIMITFDSPLGFSLDYPEQWVREETDAYAILSPSDEGLDPENLQDSALWIGIDTEAATIAEILAAILTKFPTDASTMNQGTISIAAQTWTTTQIEFDDENLEGRGIATLAVTNKDGIGYYLVAVAPLDQWNGIQPVFQQMINSFSFAQPVAAATPTATKMVNEAAADTTPTPEPTTETAASAENEPILYTVQSGDTLLAIAVEFGVSADAIAAANGIENPNDLSAGQEIVIPLTDEQLQNYLAESGVAGSGSTPAEEETATTEAETAAPTPPATAGEAAPVSGKIAYPAFNPGTNTYDIWVADVASGSQSVIASNASQPAFNKDGTLFAYRSWDLGTRGVFFRDFVGGRGGQVTRFVEDGLPSWAPDGFSFVLMSRREGDRVPRLYRGDQLGQGDTPIGFQGEYPSTMPDGRVVVRGCLPTGDCGIFTIGPNGGGEKKISGERGDHAPAPSPDGSKIAFMSAERGSNNWEIWVMNADGSNPQKLTNNGSNDGLPAWSSDGRSIAFVSDQGGQWALWAMNADGSNQRKLLNMNGSPDGVVLIDTNNSRGWLEERISWAP
jgi:LysM repeat protein